MSTILHRLAKWAEEVPESPAQRYKKRGVWKTITASEFWDRVYHLALFLESRGFGSEDVSCILSPNCPQWVHLDLAAMLVGGKSAGLYPNSNPKDIMYILKQTGAKVLSVRNADYFKKVLEDPEAGRFLESVELIITFDKDPSISPKAVTYKSALDEGRALAARISEAGSRKRPQDYLDRIDPRGEAFIIFTSGTTGNPKGALLSHDNLVFTSDMVARGWRLPMGPGEELFSFLPLCHIAEKLHSEGVGISRRYAVSFCTKFDNVSTELVEVQPTLLLSVPRLWEKMVEGVMSKIKKAPIVRKNLGLWALDVGARVAEAKFSGALPSPVDLVQLKVADRLVLSKIRQALGLERAKVIASGAAALPPYVSKWFRRLGLEVLDTLGQTESTGIICMSEPGVESAGTVGRPAPGIEVKIAEDGEILTRGRQVFKAYFKDPAATEQALEGGWLHTGDIGEITDRGLICVRGRKKDVLKTSGGKMVAPLPIEEMIKTSPIISQVCMVGDGRKYLSALITLKETTLSELRSRSGAPAGPILENREILSQVRKKIEKVNEKLATYEQIKRFAVLSKEFSIEEGEMTPTMKMKRSVIENHFQKIIDELYSKPDNSPENS
ncbi:MAG: hypothetical protein A2428_05385 [Bdellovibrionales bacterium RIFOXYC1_FULL_54_43]|nr:MAG: hypothetical protein A2428_05385 [Bdellovibrionales bacterium RIFOXYC1_FULL_54_43]OFZ81483.1 MAG: hypothetical protein A2603_07075 [Bdellovibrionales bacterium RIFOXYD1_FULL_55_31]